MWLKKAVTFLSSNTRNWSLRKSSAQVGKNSSLTNVLQYVEIVILHQRQEHWAKQMQNNLGFQKLERRVKLPRHVRNHAARHLFIGLEFQSPKACHRTQHLIRRLAMLWECPVTISKPAYSFDFPHPCTMSILPYSSHVYSWYMQSKASVRFTKRKTTFRY